MIFLFYSDDHVAVLRKLDSCSDKRFIKSLVKSLCNTKALSGGFHLRSKADICAADLFKGEYRHLNGKVFCLRLKSRLIAQILQLIAKDHFCCQRYDRDSCYLADIRHSTAGTRIYLDYIHLFAAYDKLNVDHTYNVKCFCKAACVLCNGFLCSFTDSLCRIYGNTVTGVDSRTLNMLHDTRNQNVLAVTYSVYLNLFAHQVFIYQDRMILRDLVNDSNVFFYILIADCNTHSLSAKNIGRTY